MIFFKTVSLGNDFIIVEKTEAGQGPEYTDLARTVCHRKTGIGADGLILYGLKGGSVTFRIYNRDGSRAELSGNGLAGLAALLFHLDAHKDRVRIQTDVGPRTVEQIQREDHRFKLRIEIGRPEFSDSRFFPFLKKNQLEYETAGRRFTPVSVGNPHIVILDTGKEEPTTLNREGERLETNPLFPYRTNVEFVQELTDDTCRVHFYERGVGQTLSSSTGSAAVYAALKRQGLINGPLGIACGRESVRVSGEESIFIENWTEIMYKGIWLK